MLARVSMKTVHEIRIVGGHPALDLVNTVDSRRDRWGPDALIDYADAVHWAVRAAVIDISEAMQLLALAEEHPSDASEALRRITALRELLYGIFLAEAQERGPDNTAIDQLSELSTAASHSRRLAAAGGGVMWRWQEEDLGTIGHRVTFAAAELLVDGARRRITECTGRNCGWLFLDSSKSGRRRWCSEEGCGTRERVRRLRARHVPEKP